MITVAGLDVARIRARGARHEHVADDESNSICFCSFSFWSWLVVAIRRQALRKRCADLGKWQICHKGPLFCET